MDAICKGGAGVIIYLFSIFAKKHLNMQLKLKICDVFLQVGFCASCVKHLALTENNCHKIWQLLQ